MATYRLTLEYDGTDFEGWQVQPGGRRTVQGSLEQALARVSGRRARVVGAGRTDAGVHAEGQVASVRLEPRRASLREPERLAAAVNGVLPRDLAVVAAALAPDDFHARRHARSKLYRYAIWNAREPSPLRRRRALCLRRELDLAAMRRAAAHLVGTHDFASLQSAGTPVRTTVRTLTRCELEGSFPGEIALWVEGDAFLRHMVRALAGTLVQVGSGRRDPDSLPAVLAARDRGRAGPTAPPQGLTLVRVAYERGPGRAEPALREPAGGPGADSA